MAARKWTQAQRDAAAERMRARHAAARGEAPDETPAPPLGQTEEAPPSRGEPRAFDPPPTSTTGAAASGPDPTPGRGAKKAARARTTSTRKPGKAPTDAELTSTLGKLLAAPALPAKLILKCDYCAAHFAQQANPTAVELVELAKDSPELRGFLEDLHGHYSKVTWAGILAGYVLKPIAHHLAPNDLLKVTSPFLGVPPRAEPAAAGHTHEGPAAGPFIFGPGVQPMTADQAMPDLAGLDLTAAMAAVQQMDPDTIRSAAAAMGIDIATIAPDMIAPDVVTPPDSAGQPAEPAATEPVAGQDAGQ